MIEDFDILFIMGLGSIAFIAGVFVGALIYAIADGVFDIDLSRPHDDYD